MTNSTPQQDFYSVLVGAAGEVFGPDRVFDYPPGHEAAYPYLYIGESWSDDTYNKSVVGARVTVRVHYFSDDLYTRGEQDARIRTYIDRVRGVDHTAHFFVAHRGCRLSYLTDQSTGVPLLHGVMEFNAILL